MQVILDSSFARPGSAPIWGGKKGEFRDWTRRHLNPNLDFLQVVKVTKSGHLARDRASRGCGSIPGLTSQTYLHACQQRLNTMQISL